MTVICGTDLSERSRPGLAAASAIAAAMRAPLCVAYAMGEPLVLLDPPAREQLAEAVRERLDRETAPAPGGVAVRHAVLQASPHDGLLALARAEDATLLVVSSKGHGDSPLYRIGGTSERLALDAPIPVLVVRDAAPFQGWGRGERPLRVVVGVDFTTSAVAAIRWTQALAAAGPCDVVFAHVYERAEALERYDLQASPDAAQAAGLEALLERDVAALVGAFAGLGTHTVRVRAAIDQPSATLLELARRERADLVVVGTHHRRGPARLWSVSSAVLHAAPMAVAIVPPAAAGVAAEVGRIGHVLVATDLTPESNQAIPFACSLLDRGGTLTVLHVPPPRERSEDRDRYDAAVADKLRSLVPPGVAALRITAAVEVVHGDVASTICGLAERLGADLVCVTSRHRGLARAMTSVVPDVLRESRKPVVVYRAPAP